MHPQAQLPQSAAQRQQAAQQKKDQPEEFAQYQKFQQVGFASFVCSSCTSDKASSSSKDSKNKKKRNKQRRFNRKGLLCSLKHQRCQQSPQYSSSMIPSWKITSRTTFPTIITDIARSHGPVSIRRTAATGIPIKRLGANNVAKHTVIRSTPILISTSRANSMSRGGRLMMICGDVDPEVDFAHKCDL